MAFGFLGRRRRGPRRDRGGVAAPPGGRLPHERDESVQRPPARPSDKLKRAADDQRSGRQETEARWGATGEFSKNTRTPSDKPGPVIVRKRYRI